MVGVDHERADVACRELFSFTKSRAAEAMQWMAAQPGVSGCAILSTCNRSEVWLSCHDGMDGPEPARLLCRVKQVELSQYEDVLISREREEAVWHLLQLACGLKSRIFGEDQILSQVKDCIANAREAGTASTVLEQLFRTAVTAAKRIKTEVQLTGADESTATAMLRLLRRHVGDFTDLPVLVIGNGEMGRLAAKSLVKAGCAVTMTVRQYHRGEVLVPAGCRVCNYEERLAYLSRVKAVISATASPHHTLEREEVQPVWDGTSRIFLDLAVPRDIDPDIAALPGAMLCGIDDLDQVQADVRRMEAIRQAESILEQYLLEFQQWYDFRRMVPAIDDIGAEQARYLLNRVARPIRGLDIPNEQKELLLALVERSARRGIQHMLYGLRDTLEPEYWKRCMTALYRAMMK